MGFDQELEGTKSTRTTSDKTVEQTGKRTRVDGDVDKTPTQTDEAQTKDARLATLVKQLERQFVRSPAQAKQTAVTLSVEFPERFDAAWVLKVMGDIDAAVWRKQKVETVNAAWDDRPAVAKAAIGELRARYRGV